MEENVCGNVQKFGVNGIKWSDISVLEFSNLGSQNGQINGWF